jgi:hypothetical protein
MTTRSRGLIIIWAGVLLAAACRPAPAPRPAPEVREEVAVPEAARIDAMAARFVPVDITVDLSSLPAPEQQALARLVDAAKVMDSLYLRQVWAGNETLLLDLLKDVSPIGRARLHYFLINKGPWSRLDGNEPFVPGVPPKPPDANFYPAGTTKDEIEGWLKRLPDAERRRAAGFFTTIRRAAGGFVAVPYSLEYQGELAQAAALLREAAGLTAQPTLKAFLTARADAFITNDYYASDLAWMALDSSIEPTIGPYEVYEDEWFNAKAAFEAFIAVRDEAESEKLVRFGAERQGIEDHLPIDPKYRNPKLGGLSPIRVVNVVFTAGDGNRGVQTIAYNLPNDDRVVKEKGTKNVMLVNFQAAKFKMVLTPISEIVLAPADRSDVTFDAFFSHTLMHELMHGLGPHQISIGGRATTVRQELKETYSAIEEAKADVSGLFALQYLIDTGTIDKSIERAIYRTFLASAFRSIRFGLTEAHGRGIAIQLNTLLDAGAFVVQPDGTFSVNDVKIKDAVTQLTRDLMTIEAEGNYVKAKELLQRMAVIRPEVAAILERLAHVPVDIEPRFLTADTLRPGATR